jgi:hypothetical protein
MSHDARAGVTAEDDQRAVPSWWENLGRVDVPRTRDAYQVPAQRSARNLHEGQRPGSAAANPFSPGSPAAAQAAVRPPLPPSGEARVLAATPEDRAHSEVAAAAPQSYITTDDRRVSYSDLGVAKTLDPLSNKRFLGQLARRGALYMAATAAADFAVFALSFIFSLLHPGFDPLKVVGSITVLLVIALTLAFWLLPVPALLGEWSRLLCFQAPAAQTALGHIREALDRHAIPSDTIDVRPISPPGEGRRHYLELRRGFFAGYISCFAHGHDLYIGWTYWIYVSPLRVLQMWIGRRIQDHTGRGNDMYQTLRYESAKATIAAIHACTLDGVDMATGGPTQPASRTPLLGPTGAAA